MSRKMKRYKARFVGSSAVAVPAVDWALLAKVFPAYREHIVRIKNNPVKLYELSQRLIGKRVKELRKLRTVTENQNTSPAIERILRRLGLLKKG